MCRIIDNMRGLRWVSPYSIPRDAISFSMSCIMSVYGCVSALFDAFVAYTAVLSIAIT